MLMVLGLGNPGTPYEGTRHNVGFAVLDCLAGRLGAPAWRAKKQSLVTQVQLGGQSVLLAKPVTFMNLSGQSAAALAAFYKLAISDLIVVHDELDFAVGKVRLKPGGGHGGHNGLRSIIAHLGADFARVRLGIGRPRGSKADAHFVLSPFDKAARQTIADGIERAADAVALICEKGMAQAMNQLNREDE